MMWSAVWRGTLTGLLTAVAGAILLAASLYLTDFPQRHNPYFLQGIALVSSAAAGYVAGRRAQTGGLLHGAAAGVGFFVVGSLLGLAFFGGVAPAGFLLTRLALAAVVGAIAGVMGINA